MYYDLFSNWGDVQREFAMNDPEPDEVLYAQYDHEAYGCDGSADVLYRNGDTYYYVSGGHCSCYGLEGQWSPETYSRETLLGAFARAEQAKHRYGFFSTKGAFIRERLAQ